MTQTLLRKPAQTTYEVHPLIENRWSPRAFEDRDIESEKVCSLLEAARWAPSCFNEQPWRYIVGTRNKTPQTWETLKTLLMDGNRWAQKAPVLMLGVTKTLFDHNGQPNRHAEHDLGLASAMMVLQGEAMGLQCHQMAGFEADRAPALLSIPNGFKPMVMLAFGYGGDPDTLDEKLKARELAPRSRQPLQEMVFSDYWGQPYPGCFT